MAEGRPKRNAKRAPVKKPTSSLYIGYVDDEETPEMIMKKFEMLDKLVEASNKGLLKDPKAKSKKGKSKKSSKNDADQEDIDTGSQQTPVERNPDQPLTERELELLFKMTSSFGVPKDGCFDVAFDGVYDKDDFEFSDGEENFFVGEDDFFGTAFDDNEKKNHKKRKREDKSGEARPARESKRKEKDLKGVGTYKPKMKLLSMELVGADGLYYTIKQKVKIVDPLAPTYVRIPSQTPLPRSWARSVTPYTGINHTYIPDGSTYIETDIMSFDLKSLGFKFQGVMIDPPWPVAGQPILPEHITASDLYNLRVDQIVDAGLLFIWTEKDHISDCVKVATQWGFNYVENLVWIKQLVSHTVVDIPYSTFSRSKTSLLIFRKGVGFQLRHQRNPDVIFDFLREGKHLTEDKPNYAYTIVETLLPESNFQEETQRGKFLDLWARRGMRRKGWTTIVQAIPETGAARMMPSNDSDSVPLKI